MEINIPPIQQWMILTFFYFTGFKCFFFISANSKEHSLLQTELIAIFSDPDFYSLYSIWFDFYLQCNHWKKYVIIQSPFIQVHLRYARSKYKYIIDLLCIVYKSCLLYCKSLMIWRCAVLSETHFLFITHCGSKSKKSDFNKIEGC